jgi:hypothetical protein
MRRLIFSLICSSSKAANRPKPTSVGITSSKIRIAFGASNAELPAKFRVSERRAVPTGVQRRAARGLGEAIRPNGSSRKRWIFLPASSTGPNSSHGQRSGRLLNHFKGLSGGRLQKASDIPHFLYPGAQAGRSLRQAERLGPATVASDEIASRRAIGWHKDRSVFANVLWAFPSYQPAFSAFEKKRAGWERTPICARSAKLSYCVRIFARASLAEHLRTIRGARFGDALPVAHLRLCR